MHGYVGLCWYGFFFFVSFHSSSSSSSLDISPLDLMTMTINHLTHHQSSTFNYDPETDLREEHLSLVSKRLLSTLRESKIKHLSCDNLFLPCNHIRNIARQCLIMAAEEPFGIMGAQIKIKLTLLAADMTTTISKYLPIIRINPKQKTIFEIEIDLHEDTKVFTLRHFLPQMKMFRQIRERSPLYVSPRCLLVKNVFYKTADAKRAYVNTMAWWDLFSHLSVQRLILSSSLLFLSSSLSVSRFVYFSFQNVRFYPFPYVRT